MNKAEETSWEASLALPHVFCWTRFGTEAGQSIETILGRKEQERLRNGGIFLWGIGNSVAPSMEALLAETKKPKVIFSEIKSKPRSVDESPKKIAIWTRARTPSGKNFRLPSGSLLTSRADGKTRWTHFALVCRSDSPLNLVRHGEEFSIDCLRNLKTDRPIGHSQVTAIVRRTNDGSTNNLRYKAAMIIDLVAPYVISLEQPIVTNTDGASNDELTQICWRIRQGSEAPETPIQQSLFA